MWKGLALLGVAELGASVKRSVVVGAIYAVAAVALVCSLGFLVAAGHGALAWRYGANAANLILAGWFFVLALVIALVGFTIKWRAQRRRSMATTALVVAPAVAPAAMRALARRPNLAASIAAGVLAVGALLGSRWAARSDT